jgi:hypothetical protein
VRGRGVLARPIERGARKPAEQEVVAHGWIIRGYSPSGYVLVMVASSSTSYAVLPIGSVSSPPQPAHESHRPKIGDSLAGSVPARA